MESSSITPLPERFSCPVCAKTFPNRGTRKSHAAYCRRRSRSENHPRKKSCTGCITSKTRCDSHDSRCSTCTKKGIKCSNEVQAPSVMDSLRTSESSGSELRSGELVSSSVSIATTDSLNFDLVPNTSTLSSGVDEMFSENHDTFGDTRSFFDVDWSTTIMAELEGDMTTPAISDSFCPIGVEISATCSEAFTDTGVLDYRDYANHTHSPNALNEIRLSSYCNKQVWSPIAQPVYKPFKAFLSKANAKHSSPLTHALIVNTLRSYIDGLLPGNSSLPPFIHPESFSAQIPHHVLPQPKDGQPLPQPLAICSSIIQMFQAKTKENSEFIWGTVEMARQRLAAEASSLSDWEIVTALQAIAVYFILRITEKDEHNINFDIPLIQTMMELATRTGGFGQKYLQHSTGDLPEWKNWAFVESMRRTIRVLLIICALFDITTVIHECNGTYLFELPLSCTRKLWSAKSESEWGQEYTRCAHELGEQPTPSYQDLLLLEYGKLATPSAKKSLLEKWLTEMDEFGRITVITTNYVSMGMDLNNAEIAVH